MRTSLQPAHAVLPRWSRRSDEDTLLLILGQSRPGLCAQDSGQTRDDQIGPLVALAFNHDFRNRMLSRPRSSDSEIRSDTNWLRRNGGKIFRISPSSRATTRLVPVENKCGSAWAIRDCARCRVPPAGIVMRWRAKLGTPRYFVRLAVSASLCNFPPRASTGVDRPTKSPSGRKQAAINALYRADAIGFDNDEIGATSDPDSRARTDAAAGCRARRRNPAQLARISCR